MAIDEGKLGIPDATSQRRQRGGALDASAISGSVATTVNTLSLRRPVNVALETSSRLSILIACGILSAETLAIAALGFTS